MENGSRELEAIIREADAKLAEDLRALDQEDREARLRKLRAKLSIVPPSDGGTAAG